MPGAAFLRFTGATLCVAKAPPWNIFITFIGFCRMARVTLLNNLSLGCCSGGGNQWYLFKNFSFIEVSKLAEGNRLLLLCADNSVSGSLELGPLQAFIGQSNAWSNENGGDFFRQSLCIKIPSTKRLQMLDVSPWSHDGNQQKNAKLQKIYYKGFWTERLLSARMSAWHSTVLRDPSMRRVVSHRTAAFSCLGIQPPIANLSNDALSPPGRLTDITRVAAG